MKIKIFNTLDYRNSESAIKEINLIFKHWNFRFIAPKFGLSVWKDYNQKFRLNYPQT